MGIQTMLHMHKQNQEVLYNFCMYCFVSYNVGTTQAVWFCYLILKYLIWIVRTITYVKVEDLCCSMTSIVEMVYVYFQKMIHIYSRYFKLKYTLIRHSNSTFKNGQV